MNINCIAELEYMYIRGEMLPHTRRQLQSSTNPSIPYPIILSGIINVVYDKLGCCNTFEKGHYGMML